MIFRILILLLLAVSNFCFAAIDESLVFTLVDANQKSFFCAKLPKGNSYVVKKKKYIKWKKHLAKLEAKYLQNPTEKLAKKIEKFKKNAKKRNKLCKNYLLPTDLTPIARPLTKVDVQYLLDKAGLGLSSKEQYLIDIGINQGVHALVSEFMSTHSEPAGLDQITEDLLDAQIGASTTQTPAGQRQALINYWINTNNTYPELFALFLLKIWTVSGDVIEDETFRSSFWDYYQRLRSYAYDSTYLPQLAADITTDPLMLIYLNNELNVKGNPNENYARELQELFTMGPTDLDNQPNYTETNLDGTGDIAISAKMLTGFKVQKNYSINKLVTIYDPTRHEPGPHTMYAGTPYAFTGEDYEDLILGIFVHHPNVKYYYAKEILKEYLTPDPPRPLIEALASVIASNNYNLRPAMEVLFKSAAFYSDYFKNSVTTNPMEFAAKTARILELFNGVNLSSANWQVSNMGMQYNMAPSVFWYPDNNWSGATTLLEKANYLALIFNDTTAQNLISWTPATVLPSGTATKEQVINHIIDKLGITVNSEQYNHLLSFMSNFRQWNGVYMPFDYDNTDPDHQELKGLGAYWLGFNTRDFQLK